MNISIESEKLKIDRVKKVLHQVPVAIGITILNSIILVLVLIAFTPVSRSSLLIWLSAVILINLTRIFIQNHFYNKEITSDNVSLYLNIFLSALFISGCAWGSAGIFIFLLPSDSIAHLFIAFMLGGMVAGSVGVFASVIEAFYCFTIPIILPISIMFFRYEDNIHFTMGLMILIFWFVMLMTAKRLNKEIFFLRYENADLISSLEIEINERKSAEEMLIKRNNEIEDIVEERTAELSNVNAQLLREIDERKTVTRALTRSEEKYRELANSLPQIVFEADENGAVSFANRNAFKAFGYDNTDFMNQFNLLDMVVPEEREKAASNIKKILTGEKSKGAEYTALRKDGSTFPILSHTEAIKKDDKVVGLLGVVIDLTIQKLEEKNQRDLEVQLQRARKMEALATLAGGVAHDLNNILSGIVGYPDLLLMQLPEDSPFRKPVITMQESGKKAAAIVQDLLTLTRRNVISDKIVNLNDIISEYLNSPECEKLMSYHRSVRLKASLDSDLLNISGSSVHLAKSVMNLVSNAAEALPDGGDIIITTENRYLDRPLRGYDEIAEGDYAVMKIKDTGTGIPASDIDRIFEPFFTKKTMGKSGTGLGMTVVWGTVKDHNGYIDVETIENAGTTFTLFFPVTRGDLSETLVDDDLSLYQGKGETVLVVDDVETQMDIAHAMLTQLGYSVSAVSSGEEAIQYVRRHKTDLIILDMIMQPGIDGLTTYKNILEINPDQKAVIASGYSETSQVKETISLGAGAYIKKPFTLITLAKVVRKELDSV